MHISSLLGEMDIIAGNIRKAIANLLNNKISVISLSARMVTMLCGTIGCGLENSDFLRYQLSLTLSIVSFL
jgi:intracellular septation protein A